MPRKSVMQCIVKDITVNLSSCNSIKVKFSIIWSLIRGETWLLGPRNHQISPLLHVYCWIMPLVSCTGQMANSARSTLRRISAAAPRMRRWAWAEIGCWLDVTCHERRARGNIVSDFWVNLHYSVYFSVCRVNTQIRPPETAEYLSGYSVFCLIWWHL